MTNGIGIGIDLYYNDYQEIFEVMSPPLVVKVHRTTTPQSRPNPVTMKHPCYRGVSRVMLMKLKARAHRDQSCWHENKHTSVR